MSIKSWTWFDEELDAISSLGSSQHSLASSTLTLTKSLTPSQHNLILTSGFLINSNFLVKEREEDRTSPVFRTDRLRNLMYREEYSDEVMSLTEVSRPSYDLGYQTQSKSEGGLNMYDDAPTPSSGVIMDIDLMMSDGSYDQIMLPLPGTDLSRFRQNIQDSERLSLSERSEDSSSSSPRKLERNILDREENTFSWDTASTVPSFLKTFGHGSPDLYGRLYFGSEEDLEVGNSAKEEVEVYVCSSAFLFHKHTRSLMITHYPTDCV